MQPSASKFHWNSACSEYKNAYFFRKTNNAFIFINVTDKGYTGTDYDWFVFSAAEP